MASFIGSYAKQWLATAIVASIAIWLAGGVVLMLVAAILLAVFLRGVAGTIARRLALSTSQAVVAVVLGLIAGAALLAILVAPAVDSQIQQLGDRLPTLVDSVENGMQHSPWGRWILSQLPEPAEIVDAGKPLLGSVPGAFRSTFGGIFNLFLIGIIALYLALDAPRYTSGFVRLFAAPLRPAVENVLSASGEVVRGWLLAQLLSMTVLGVCTFVGLTLMGVPLALLMALITAALTFIPNLGPVLSVVPPVLLALAQDPWMALWVLVFYVVLQILEGNFLTPMLMRETIAMPPALLLAAQLLSAALLGFWGLVLAAPLTAVGMVLVQEIHVKRMDTRECACPITWRRISRYRVS